MNCAVAPIDDLFRVTRCEGKVRASVTRISASCGEPALECIGQICIADCSGIAAVANTQKIVLPACPGRDPHFKVDGRI